MLFLENCPPNPIRNSNPDPNPKRGAIFLEGNCADTKIKQQENVG